MVDSSGHYPGTAGTCVPNLLATLPAVLTLLTTSLTVLVATCLLSTATAASGHPRSQLGLRPPGRGLWTYLSGRVGDGVGVWGCGTSPGANALLLRVVYHAAAAYLAVWSLLSLVTAAVSLASPAGHEYCSKDVWSDGIVATAAYFGGLFLSFSRRVSHPGGPGEHRIRRMPRWNDDRTTESADATMGGRREEEKEEEKRAGGEKDGEEKVEWRRAVAEGSHRVMLSLFGLDGGNAAAAADKAADDGGGDDGGSDRKVAQDLRALYESWSIFQPFRDRVRKAGQAYRHFSRGGSSGAVARKAKQSSNQQGNQPVAATHPRGAMRLTYLLLTRLLIEPAIADPLEAVRPLRGGPSANGTTQKSARQLGAVASVIQDMLAGVDNTVAKYVGNCDPDDKCGICQGDCDSDEDCLGQLRCYARDLAFVAVPGCMGAEEEIEEYDYCYMPPMDIGPDVWDTGFCNEGECGLCEGDCDFDSDCEGDLKCFQRHYSHTDVPGCYGASFVDVRTDYCYKPHPPAKDELALVICSPDDPCPKCRGGCFSNSDCEGDLECFTREQAYMPVPGCRNGHNFEDFIAFCYDPRDDNVVREVGCDSDFPCDKCQGDCDEDEDCMPGLKCFQRELPYQLVPGCVIGTDKSVSDFCYDPEEDGEERYDNFDEPNKDDWPDSFFNYDLNDDTYGPAGWEYVDVNDNEWMKYENLDSRVDENRCGDDDQSPIDINTVNAECKETHHIYYFGGMTEEMNSRGLVEYAITPFRLRVNFEKERGIDPPQIDPPGGVAGGITRKDATHAEYIEPSEHTIGGKRFDGEFRIFHAQDKYENIVAVAMMVEVSYEHNPHFEVILRKWESVYDCGNGNGRTDIAMEHMEVYNVVTSMYFWGYEGSLTEPPCSPIVQWRVLDTPVRISKEQKKRAGKLLTDGGPCKDHALRKSPQQNGGARPIQRDANDAMVWRCTIHNYMWERERPGGT